MGCVGALTLMGVRIKGGESNRGQLLPAVLVNLSSKPQKVH